MKFYKECTICKHLHWVGEPCVPEYKVFHEDFLGDGFKLIRASNAKDAALSYAHYYNVRSEYALMNEEMEIEVEDGGVKIKFVVSAEPDIHYSAKQL